MTRITISISKFDRKAKALIEYLKTLDFIKIEEEVEYTVELSKQEANAIEKGLKDIEDGRLVPDEEVRKSIHDKIVNYGAK